MAKFKPISDSVFKRATARAERSVVPFAVRVSFDRRRHRIKVKLNTGVELSFDPHAAYGLEEASDHDLAEVMLEGGGSALHFPRLDAFFSIPRLLEGFLGPLEWTRREARAAASRENGRLGGRPRKVTIHEAA
jgi:hypothetical protein